MCIINFSLCVFVGDALRCAVSGIFHNLFIVSLGSWMIIFPLGFIVNFFL